MPFESDIPFVYFESLYVLSYAIFFQYHDAIALFHILVVLIFITNPAYLLIYHIVCNILHIAQYNVHSI